MDGFNWRQTSINRSSHSGRFQISRCGVVAGIEPFLELRLSSWLLGNRRDIRSHLPLGRYNAEGSGELCGLESDVLESSWRLGFGVFFFNEVLGWMDGCPFTLFGRLSG